MSTDKKINMIAITLILLALFGTVYAPEYKLWFNMIAIIAYICTILYQCFLLYKEGKEWKKYLTTNIVLCIVLGIILFI